MGYLVTKPFEIFLDSDGTPLENGYLYFGTVSQNPETNPISIYWDADLTIPAANPVRTVNGYAARNGTPANLYTSSNYSITVKDKNGRLVYNSQINQAIASSATLQVDGMTELRKLNPLSTNVVYLKYHTSPFDRGHGEFESLTTGGPYTDDNGITIVPTGGDGSSCWRRVYSGAVEASWFNADATYATDTTTALQSFINYVINNNTRGHIAEGRYKFTRLYLCYDSVNNPGITATDGYADGSWEIYGDGEMNVAQYNHSDRIGTVLESTSTTGNIIIHEPASETVGSRMRNKTLRSMSILSDTTGIAVSLNRFHTSSGLYHIFIHNNNASGSGLLIKSSYTSNFNDVFVNGPASTNTGIGISVQMEKGAVVVAGGLSNFYNTTSARYGTGWKLGENEYNLATAGILQATRLFQCQASTCGVGLKVGWRSTGAIIDGFFAESCTTASVRIGDGARDTYIFGGDFSGNPSDAHIGVGYNSLTGLYDQAQEYSTSIVGTHIWAPDTGVSASGVAIRLYDNNNSPTTVNGNTIVPMATATPNGVGIAYQGTHRDAIALGNRFVGLATKISGTTQPLMYTDQTDILNLKAAKITSLEMTGDLISSYNAVASASSMNIDGLTIVNVTGTTNIDTLTPAEKKLVILKFNDVLTVNDSTGNLRLAGNFTTSSADTITLIGDGTNYYELARSIN